MKKNLLILLGLLVVCGLAARYLQGQQQARAGLVEDICKSLEVFWKTRGHRVELVPEGDGVRASVAVVLPEKTGRQRRQWNLRLVAFVGARHPKLKLVGLEMNDGREPIQPENRALSARPYAAGGNDQDRAELVRREAQGWLDNTIGTGHSLALVECTSTQVKFQNFSGTSVKNYYMASGVAYVPHEPRTYYRTETQTTLVVVLDGRTDYHSAMVRLKEMPRTPEIIILP